VQTSGSTIYRTKKRFVEISLEAALSEEPRPERSEGERTCEFQNHIHSFVDVLAL